MNGIELIAKERQRQIDAEGFTPDHDDGHGNGELIAAARCYAQYAQYQHVPNGTADGNHPQWWPWDEEWWKPSADPIRNIAKAGALLAADIDRRHRKAGHLENKNRGIRGIVSQAPIKRERPVTADEAQVAVQRLVNSHFNNPDGARTQIPASVMDDDLVASDYIIESRERIAELEAENLRLNNELNAGDSWAWIRRKFESAGHNYRWFKPREWANRDSLIGTRYEVMGWIHCIFGDANAARTYLDICLEQQKRADDAEAENARLKAVDQEMNALMLKVLPEFSLALREWRMFSDESKENRDIDHDRDTEAEWYRRAVEVRGELQKAIDAAQTV